MNKKCVVLYNNTSICNNQEGIFLYYCNIVFMYYMVYQLSIYDPDNDIFIYDVEGCNYIKDIENINYIRRDRLFNFNIYLDRCRILYDEVFSDYDLIHSIDNDILFTNPDLFKIIKKTDIKYFSGIEYKNKYGLDCILATFNLINNAECKKLYNKDKILETIYKFHKEYGNCYSCNNEERVFGELFNNYNYNNYSWFKYFIHFNNDKKFKTKKKNYFLNYVIQDHNFIDYISNINLLENYKICLEEIKKTKKYEEVDITKKSIEQYIGV